MLFCKPIRNKSRYKPNRKLDSVYSFSEFEKASLINKADWLHVVSEDSIFFNLNYLSLIEKCTHVSLKCRYVIIYKNQEACAIIYFQLAEFKANVFGDLLKGEIDEIRSHRMKLFEKYVESKNADDVLFSLFTCGNNLVSGDYGFHRTEQINKEDFYKLFPTLLKTIASEESLKGKISAMLIKDFYEPIPEIEQLDNFKLEKFFVEPNLMVSIPKEVKTLSDYIQLFSKKYRNRAKGILKNRELFQIKELNLNEIIKDETFIYELYKNIYAKAKFKLLLLPQNYFSETKQIFGDRFFLKAIIHNNKIVAFFSGFIMPHGDLEAHYIGLDYAVNETLDLYQNILYCFVELAIEKNMTVVNLGRTAAEIKTTMGAKAHDLTCYVQPQNTVSKLISKPFIEFLKPKEWTPRNPFKEEA